MHNRRPPDGNYELCIMNYALNYLFLLKMS